MHKKGRRDKSGHIRDSDRKHQEPSYQTVRQDMRQSEKKNTHNFGRDDLGFTNRNTKGYDKQYKGDY
ncbi:hypothetical protein D3C87_190310 [compost metagenome]